MKKQQKEMAQSILEAWQCAARGATACQCNVLSVGVRQGHGEAYLLHTLGYSPNSIPGS